jgi:hypothetical protein
VNGKVLADFGPEELENIKRERVQTRTFNAQHSTSNVEQTVMAKFAVIER